MEETLLFIMIKKTIFVSLKFEIILPTEQFQKFSTNFLAPFFQDIGAILEEKNVRNKKLLFENQKRFDGVTFGEVIG